jgi:hypothetical protein
MPLDAMFLQDLSIGKELDIYGRTFLLVDANNSTRKYCSDICKRALGTWTVDSKQHGDALLALLARRRHNPGEGDGHTESTRNKREKGRVGGASEESEQ